MSHASAPKPGDAPKLRLVQEDGRGADRGLVEAISAGDEGAAAQLHDRLRPHVSRTILRLLRRREEHGDLVQQSMIELVLSIDRFRGQCSLESWAAAVTAHVVFKHLRKNRRERQVFSSYDDPVAPAGDVAWDDGEAPARRSVLARIRHHLEQMDEGRATVFVLHEVHGYDLREISEIVGISVANAQTRLVRGRKELHERVRQDASLAEALEGRARP